MSIGYACLTLGVLNANLKSCTAKNATEENLLDIILHNLNSLENMIEYNIRNDIKLFRISSDLIPFGSSPLNKLTWWEIFSERFSEIGRKIKENNIRVSMHPGQYTVLNSPNSDVVKRAVEDLNYHARVLECLDVGAEHKIILHIGGIYNDKEQAIQRFADNYMHLSDSIKQRLVIENDDKLYNINDVLEIGKKLNIPVVFDNLHNEINFYSKEISESNWINQCKSTWKENDGCQKIHYSQQDPLKKTGSHSSTIKINKFIEFYKSLEREDIDIMLEVKDKNLSAVKCINSLTKNKQINKIEDEWSKYKYKILESNPSNYLKIRNLLKNKDDYPIIKFYNYIENSMDDNATIGNSINAAMHIWGYFKDIASDKEKNDFFKSIEAYKQEKISVSPIKNKLWKMAGKYNQSYLLNSYYFVF